MAHAFAFIRKRLHLKILLALTVGAAIVIRIGTIRIEGAAAFAASKVAGLADPVAAAVAAEPVAAVAAGAIAAEGASRAIAAA